MSNDDDGPIMEGGGKGKLYYSQNIMNQVDRIGKRASEPLELDDRSRESFKNAVLGLEAILRPYEDKDYLKEKDKIKNDSKTHTIYEVKDFFLIWGALSCLIKRAGLMPMDEVTMVDDDSESYNPLATK